MGARGIGARPERKPRKGALTWSEFCALQWGNNFFHNLGPVFKDEASYYACWLRHRTKLITKSPGTRPWAWWVYEGGPMGLRCPKGKDRAAETILLYEAGILTRAEIETLMPQWRQHWEQAQEPGFTYHDGGDRWLDCHRAAKAHRLWAGVPLKVWLAFDAEREASMKARA